jgi:hypothetical protein
LRRETIKENIKNAPTIFTGNWGEKLPEKLLKVR